MVKTADLLTVPLNVIVLQKRWKTKSKIFQSIMKPLFEKHPELLAPRIFGSNANKNLKVKHWQHYPYVCQGMSIEQRKTYEMQTC